MIISAIVVIDEKNAIGFQNQLLCHLPADLKHFKSITTGHPIVMGRKTMNSLNRRPLPNRTNIVLSRKECECDGFVMVDSFDKALDHCKNEDEIFIIGGGQIYRGFFDKFQKLYITRIKHQFAEADTFFPEIGEDDWELVSREDFNSDEKNCYDYSFLEYIRRK